MTDTQSVISILGCVLLLIYVIMNLSYVSDHKLYKKKYQELQRGVYRFEPRGSELTYFNLYSYNINTLEFQRTDCDIIFFPDGDIKLTENLYIHKNHLFMSLYVWYYWRKFQRLKDDTIREYNFMQAHSRMSRDHYERYMKQQNKLDFKFLRG
jgi:hypothetical protein